MSLARLNVQFLKRMHSSKILQILFLLDRITHHQMDTSADNSFLCEVRKNILNFGHIEYCSALYYLCSFVIPLNWSTVVTAAAVFSKFV